MAQTPLPPDKLFLLSFGFRIGRRDTLREDYLARDLRGTPRSI